MEWRRLMSARRYRGLERPPAEDPAEPRSAFVRDSDRIVFSRAFRRLQDKTQVQLAPRLDVVRTRLTHSLEASSVGRSLGMAVGRLVLQATDEDLHGLEPADFGAVVAAACLAHDIGNPPFGHAGEDAIQHWFGEHGQRAVLEGLSAENRADLEVFEGNAHGFSMLTRLESLGGGGGMRLTCATLGTVMKYPHTSLDEMGARRRKFSVFRQDLKAFEVIAKELGLAQAPDGHGYARHPLSYVVEAADDIAYLIADIDDGIEAGLLRIEEAIEPLLGIVTEESAGDRDFGWLRARAIGALMAQAAGAFAADQDGILAGRRAIKAGLLRNVPATPHIDRILAISRQRLYDHHSNLEAEVAGYEAMHGLLANYVPALLYKEKAGPEGKAAPKHELIYKLLGSPDVSDRYTWLLAVAGRIASMTDSVALDTYRRLKGISMTAPRTS